MSELRAGPTHVRAEVADDAAEAEPLSEAFERLVRYVSIASEGVFPQSVDGKDFGLVLKDSADRQEDCHQTEFLMVALVRACQKLTGRPLRPSRVRFAHYRKAASAEFRGILGTNVKFGASKDELVFVRSARDLPVISADPYLNKLLIGYCEEALSTRRTRDSTGSTRASSASASPCAKSEGSPSSSRSTSRPSSRARWARS